MPYSEAFIAENLTLSKEQYQAAMRMDSYTIKDRSLKRQSLADIKKEMDKWQNLQDDIDAGRTRSTITVKRFVPLDT